jgi:YesN/AraC family two-component response regulator
MEMANTGQSLSILLVEDEGASLEILANIISKKYPEIALYTADNGKKGLEIFNDQSIEIVITDINMPEISGLQMAKKMHTLKPESKFIFITGNTEKLSRHDSKAENFEMEYYIPKPIEFGLLFAAIEQCISEFSNS